VTYTYTILKISRAAYEEIRDALAVVGYNDQFHEHTDHGVVIDMNGLALGVKDAEAPEMQELYLEGEPLEIVEPHFYAGQAVEFSGYCHSKGFVKVRGGPNRELFKICTRFLKRTHVPPMIVTPVGCNMPANVPYMLPIHWVGCAEKRRLPVLPSPLAGALQAPCAECANRAVDDTRKVEGGHLVTVSETVYCSRHGWEFPTAADEKKFTCWDFSSRVPISLPIPPPERFVDCSCLACQLLQKAAAGTLIDPKCEFCKEPATRYHDTLHGAVVCEACCGEGIPWKPLPPQVVNAEHAVPEV
jgi:hypothetical protein